MGKRSVALWYLLVILDVLFFITGIIKVDLTLGACAFFLSMVLSRDYDMIPLPKKYQHLIDNAKLNSKDR